MTLSYDVAGSGPAVVLLHSTVCDRRMWDPQMTALADAGGHDLADFRQIAAELSNRLPGARHLELPWAGHLPSMERPDELNPVLLDLLNGTLATR